MGSGNKNNSPLVPLWVVYKHPRDHPEHYVARRWYFDRPTGDVFVRDSLDAVRACLPVGMHRLERNALDDPVIVEVWV